MSAVTITQQVIDNLDMKVNYILSYYMEDNKEMSFTIDIILSIFSAILCCICLFSFLRITTFFLSSRRIGFLEIMSSLLFPFFSAIMFFVLFCASVFKPSNPLVYQYELEVFTLIFIIIFYVWIIAKIIEICDLFACVFLLFLAPLFFIAFCLIPLNSNTIFFNLLFLFVMLCFLLYDCFMLVYSSQSYISNCFRDAFLLFLFCCNLVYTSHYFLFLLASALVCEQIQVEYTIKKRKIEAPFVVIKTFNIYDEPVKTKVYY